MMEFIAGILVGAAAVLLLGSRWQWYKNLGAHQLNLPPEQHEVLHPAKRRRTMHD